jgi:hypothetical protein
MTSKQFHEMIYHRWLINGNDLEKAELDAKLYLELNEVVIKDEE